MEPVLDHKGLLKIISWMPQKEYELYIIILANPNSNKIALQEIYDNFIYLDKRTEEIKFFMPGYLNDRGNIITHNFSFLPLVDVDNGKKINFDQNAFFRTVKWLESYGYSYSESAELLLIEHNKISPEMIHKSDDGGFNLRNITSFNLDMFVKKGINLTAFFKDCMKVVRNEIHLRDLKLKYIDADNKGINEDSYGHRIISVFIAGSKKLSEQRDIVRSALMGINNRSTKGYFFKALSFEDFATSLTPEGRQEDYNNYIKNHADYVLFVLDGNIGGISFQEFDIAINTFKENNRPKIVVYNKIKFLSRILGHRSHDIERIIQSINENGQYYVEYRNERELEFLIKENFFSYL